MDENRFGQLCSPYMGKWALMGRIVWHYAGNIWQGTELCASTDPDRGIVIFILYRPFSSPFHYNINRYNNFDSLFIFFLFRSNHLVQRWQLSEQRRSWFGVKVSQGEIYSGIWIKRGWGCVDGVDWWLSRDGGFLLVEFWVACPNIIGSCQMMFFLECFYLFLWVCKTKFGKSRVKFQKSNFFLGLFLGTPR